MTSTPPDVKKLLNIQGLPRDSGAVFNLVFLGDSQRGSDSSVLEHSAAWPVLSCLLLCFGYVPLSLLFVSLCYRWRSFSFRHVPQLEQIHEYKQLEKFPNSPDHCDMLAPPRAQGAPRDGSRRVSC